MRGKKMVVRVRNAEFSHMVIEFDTGLDLINANISKISQGQDYTLLDVTAEISVVLSRKIPKVRLNDVIYIPQRKLVLKLNDNSILETAVEHKLQWEVSTRVLQPQEALRNIATGKALR